MNIIISPDSFKGTLAAKEIINIISEEALKVFPYCKIVGLPMADGGEGTMDILFDICKGTYFPVTVHGPLFEERESKFAILEDGTALIEMAASSALPMVPLEKQNPEETTTLGTGELIREALLKGCRKFVIGVGGSATNDGGMGAISALGVKFADEKGSELSPVGKNLINVRHIDISGLMKEAKEASFTIMCDVDNPLVGPRGATYVFSPQKGADAEMQDRLERGMKNYAAVLKSELGTDPSFIPGAGAAGGLATGLMLFLNGKISSGISTVLELSHFEEYVKNADLVITGEGRADSQSAHGKVLWGVGNMCQKYGKKAAAIVGCLGDGYEELYDCGISEIMPVADHKNISSEYAMSHPEETLRATAQKYFTNIKL